MDEQTTIIDEAFKKELKKKLVNDLISGLENNNLDFKGMRASSNYILDHLDDATDYVTLMNFLDHLHNTWPTYTTSYNLYKNMNHKTTEKDVINKLESYIKSMN